MNALIEGCHTAIQKAAPNCIFSVSPAASIEKNISELYADLEKWMSDKSIDCIIPQLYFGFDYPDKAFRFENLLQEWKSLVSRYEGIDLQIGLACYKIQTESEPDYEEWHNRTDIIARQVKLCQNDSLVDGCVFFSYRSLFSKEDRNTLQREGLKNS